MRKPNPKVPEAKRCLWCAGWGFTIRRVDDNNEPYDCVRCDGTGRRDGGSMG